MVPKCPAKRSRVPVREVVFEGAREAKCAAVLACKTKLLSINQLELEKGTNKSCAKEKTGCSSAGVTRAVIDPFAFAVYHGLGSPRLFVGLVRSSSIAFALTLRRWRRRTDPDKSCPIGSGLKPLSDGRGGLHDLMINSDEGSKGV